MEYINGLTVKSLLTSRAYIDLQIKYKKIIVINILKKIALILKKYQDAVRFIHGDPNLENIIIKYDNIINLFTINNKWNIYIIDYGGSIIKIEYNNLLIYTNYTKYKFELYKEITVFSEKKRYSPFECLLLDEYDYWCRSDLFFFINYLIRYNEGFYFFDIIKNYYKNIILNKSDKDNYNKILLINTVPYYKYLLINIRSMIKKFKDNKDKIVKYMNLINNIIYYFNNIKLNNLKKQDFNNPEIIIIINKYIKFYNKIFNDNYFELYNNLIDIGNQEEFRLLLDNLKDIKNYPNSISEVRIIITSLNKIIIKSNKIPKRTKNLITNNKSLINNRNIDIKYYEEQYLLLSRGIKQNNIEQFKSVRVQLDNKYLIPSELINLLKINFLNVKIGYDYRYTLLSKIDRGSIRMDRELAKKLYKMMAFNKSLLEIIYNRFKQWNLLYDNNILFEDYLFYFKPDQFIYLIDKIFKINDNSF